MTFRSFRWALMGTAAGLIAAGVYGGLHAILVVAMLIALEIAVSFDNAVVNAGVLRQLSPAWQRAFLTIGVLIAVFGMRVVFPIAIVAIATGEGMQAILDQALHNQEAYAQNVERASAVIGAFGGMFLLLLASTFLLDPDRERHWLGPVERPLASIGKFPQAATLLAAGTLLGLAQFVSKAHQLDTLAAGLAGIVTFLTVRGFRDLLAVGRTAAPKGGMRGVAGLSGFLYLETIDASFSVDGVLGAFAISSDIVLVGVGLGVGALYIRALTVALVRRQTLGRFPFLTHGAHWAIAALAVFLLVGIETHPPEWLTGCVGLAFIGAAAFSSE